DILCVLGQDKDLDSLSELFSEAPLAEEAARFFGDFFLDVGLLVAAVSDCYGIELGSEEEREMTLKQLVDQELGAHPVLGDSFEWHDITWVVADIDDHKVVKLGLCLPKTTLEEDVNEA
ncbi:transporter associated domain-containing protein, partial [Vibrio splendidus]